MTRKLCGGCLRLRDYSEFQKSHTRPGGLQPRCRECCSRRDRKRRKMKPPTKPLFETEKPSAVGTVVLPGVPEVRADVKTQNKCRYRVAKAVALGLLSRPQRCTICRRSRDEVGVLHAHHEDYTNPLSVVFLCQSCHEIVHGNENKRICYCQRNHIPIKGLVAGNE